MRLHLNTMTPRPLGLALNEGQPLWNAETLCQWRWRKQLPGISTSGQAAVYLFPILLLFCLILPVKLAEEEGRRKRGDHGPEGRNRGVGAKEDQEASVITMGWRTWLTRKGEVAGDLLKEDGWTGEGREASMSTARPSPNVCVCTMAFGSTVFLKCQLSDTNTGYLFIPPCSS